MRKRIKFNVLILTIWTALSLSLPLALPKSAKALEPGSAADVIEIVRQGLTPKTGAASLRYTIASGALRPTEAIDGQTLADSEIVHGPTNRRAMALTFDCGADVASLTRILDTLVEGQAQATFFLEGKFVEKSPEIVGQIFSQGHDVANHSYSHPPFTTLTYTQTQAELVQTENLMSQAIGQPLPMRYFRYPYGDRNAESKAWIAELGYQSVFWDIDPQGWRKTVTHTAVISTVLNQAHPGGIVLMHCATPADETALPLVIQGLREQGYLLESLSQMLAPVPSLAELRNQDGM